MQWECMGGLSTCSTTWPVGCVSLELSHGKVVVIAVISAIYYQECIKVLYFLDKIDKTTNH